MAVAVRVSATVTGYCRRGVQEHELELELPPGTVTARQLIEAAVTAEVAAYEARAEETSLVGVLTEKSLADGLARGTVKPGGRQEEAGEPAAVDVTAAVDAALLAFGDGFFKVFVGDSELADDDAEGTPGLSVARDGRAIKSVPAALRKDPDVTALQARKTALAKQAARVRQSLEAAMVAQDLFTPDDFAELRRHPVVAPMLAQLVWVTEDGETRMLGDRLRGADVPLRIAHPVDLAAEGSWVSWQERAVLRSAQAAVQASLP